MLLNNYATKIVIFLKILSVYSIKFTQYYALYTILIALHCNIDD